MAALGLLAMPRSNSLLVSPHESFRPSSHPLRCELERRQATRPWTGVAMEEERIHE